MTMDDEDTKFVGRRFPPEAEPLENLTYRYKIGGNEIEDLTWQGHMKVAHDCGMQSREVEVVDSGTTDGGILYAAVKVTVEMEGGRRFSSIQAADETTNQVRDPEYVWAVAESRAFKRAVKNALNIYAVEDVDEEKLREEESDRRRRTGGNVQVDDDDNVDVDPPDDHVREGPGNPHHGSDDDGGYGF